MTVEESAIVLARIDRDRGDAVVDKLTKKNVVKYLGDWKVGCQRRKTYHFTMNSTLTVWQSTRSGNGPGSTSSTTQ